MAEPGDIGAELAGWGRVILLETRGRVSGRAIRVPVGFVEGGEGSLLVAAADDAVHWARNLARWPACRVEREGVVRSYQAEPLHDPERGRAIVALILRYGTPAERLGAGPAFRLRPVPDADVVASA